MVEEWNDDENYHDLLNETSLLEEGDAPEFLEWTKIEGSKRIDELSRQLNTFFNYKNSIIRLRFSGTQIGDKISKKDEIVRFKKNLTELYSRYHSLLKMSGTGEDTIEEQIRHLMIKAMANPKGLDGKHLKELNKLSDETWMILHALSTRELHLHPILLNSAITIAGLASVTQGAFFHPFDSFYGELKNNFSRLKEEVMKLRPSPETMPVESKNTKKRRKILE